MREELRFTLEEMRLARLGNLEAFAMLAALGDAGRVGYRPRDPRAPDVTMAVIAMAVEAAPASALYLLRRVRDNDRAVMRLTERLIDQLEEEEP